MNILFGRVLELFDARAIEALNVEMGRVDADAMGAGFAVSTILPRLGMLLHEE